MASAAVVRAVPLAGLVKELSDASSPVSGKGAPLAGLVRELLDGTSAIVIRGAPLAGLVKELTAAAPASGTPVTSALRLLNAKRALSPYVDDSDDDDHDDDEDTSEKPSGDTADNRLALDLPGRNRLALDLPVAKRFSTATDKLDRFGEPAKTLRLLGLMPNGGSASGNGFSGHGWWVSKEDDDVMQLKVEMPGLGKEHVKVTADKNILVIKGEGDKILEDGKGPAPCSRRIQLPAEAFKMDQIKAEMNNGVLKVTVPKIKDVERKDVFQIKVE